MALAAMLQNTSVSPSWPTNVEPTSRAHRCFSLVRSLIATDDPGVDRLPDDEAGQSRDDQLGVGVHDVLERRLVLVEVGGGQVDRHPEGERGQHVHREAEEDRAPGGLEAVHLGQHVADHVGQREDDEPAVGE